MAQDFTEAFGEIPPGGGLHTAEGSCSDSPKDGIETARWKFKRC
jgi:hypothetical protein